MSAILFWHQCVKYEYFLLLFSTIDTLRPKQNGRHFADDIFKLTFLNDNGCIFIQISLASFRMVQSTIASIGQQTGLAPGRHQAIIWTMIYQLTYACRPCIRRCDINILNHLKIQGQCKKSSIAGLILVMGSANERRRYNVTRSLIGWIQKQNDPRIELFITRSNIARLCTAL